MKLNTGRLMLVATVLSTGLFGINLPANAAVTSSPTFEIDGSNASSLARTGATAWRDLVSSGAITGALSGSAAYNAAGGGSLLVSGTSTYGGAAFPATISGTPTNPSGDMSLMMWVRFSSFNPEWNIFATRWFSNAAGAAAQDWHFAVRTLGANRYLNLYTTNKDNIYGSTTFATDTWYLVGFTLTWAGSLQFYVNGVADGPVITGATRNANSSAQFWIGDARTNCSGCAMNGNISRARLWNSRLDSTTILNDFNLERENFGYAPFVSSASFSMASNTPIYRTLNTITATVPINSKVTFFENSRIIPRCKRVTPVGTTAICNWKPSTRGQINVRVSYTLSGSSIVYWAPNATTFVNRRVSAR